MTAFGWTEISHSGDYGCVTKHGRAQVVWRPNGTWLAMVYATSVTSKLPYKRECSTLDHARRFCEEHLALLDRQFSNKAAE